MKTFDPITDIEGSARILYDGQWPSFHDAEVCSISLWRGDMRPDADVWIGPVIETQINLIGLAKPFQTVLKFHDCDEIQLSGFNHQNAIYEIEFSYKERGFLTDDVTPITPWICVRFVQAFGVALTFKCFRVEVTGRQELKI